jgi:hypothetical protein
MKKPAFIAAAGALALAAACADEMPRDVQQATTPATPPEAMPPDTLVDEFAREPDTLPPGGYVDWIEDIRRELPRVLEEATADRGNALDALRQLYMTRIDALRLWFGEGGKTTASMAMASAITRADEQFQELMRQLADADVPVARLREGASALLSSLEQVQAEGTAAGLSPDAPRE